MATKKKIRAGAAQKQIIAFSAPVLIAAAEGEKAAPTFNVTAYTGGALSVSGWDRRVVIDIAGLEFARSVIANLDHDQKQRVGHVTEKTKTESEVVLSGKFSAANSYRAEVIESAADEFPWEASVEVTPTKIDEVAAGKKVTVNGQEFTGPLYVARKGVLTGFGFVSHGADPNTVVSIAAEAASPKEQKMRDEVKAWLAETVPSLDVDTFTEEQVKAAEQDYDGMLRAEKMKSGKAKDKSTNPFEARKLEAKRREEIREIADSLLESRKNFLTEKEIDAVEKMHDHAIEAEMSPLEFRVELQAAMLPQAHTVYAPKIRDKGLTGEVLEAAICLTSGLSDKSLNAHFSDETLQTAKDRFRSGIGIKQMYRLAARQNGYHYDGDDVTLDMQRAAFGHSGNRMIQASGGFGNYDLASVLSNVANKFLLEGWGQGEMVWRDITDIVSVRDFKQASFFKLAGNMKYRKVKPGGQLEHGDVATDSYTVQNETYGIMFGIDRTSIINDDLGAITRIPLEMGIGANDAFNEVFWTEFLDNASFFSSGNNNVADGTLTPSTVLATLTATEAAFLLQTKPNGTPLGQLPTVWLVPPLHKRLAMAAMDSTKVVGGSTTVPEVNTFAGDYKVVSSAYIANELYTGADPDAHYLLANRPGFSTMLTSFLNGRQSPVVETADASFNELGVKMRAYHDFGVNKMEFRAGVKGSGDAGGS